MLNVVVERSFNNAIMKILVYKTLTSKYFRNNLCDYIEVQSIIS